MNAAQDRYHHGDLPNALRRAAVEVIGERGLDAFSLREVARRAGVSHTAPAHHFGDVRGLLTAVAAEGFQTLEMVLAEAAAQHDDPAERLTAIGEAYVALARSHSAHLAVMFRREVIDNDNEELQGCGLRAYDVLERTVRDLIAYEGVDVELDDVTWMAWSAMQGLVVLEDKFNGMNELRGKAPISTRELIRRFTSIIVRGMHAG